MRYIKPAKLKVMMAAFLGTGIFGIGLGLYANYFNLTLLGVINLCLGGVVGWLFFTQAPKLRDKRKKQK
jgi:predicted lipid-binding transport protein (Tim44 family)